MEADSPANPTTSLKNVEALLRCPVCFDFLQISMMTKCSHNFCSLCIRKFLSYKLECPLCRSPAVELDLRNNRLLDDLVTSFKTTRQQRPSTGHLETPPATPKTESSASPRESRPQRSPLISTHFLQKGLRASLATSSAFPPLPPPPPPVKEEPMEVEMSALGSPPPPPSSVADSLLPPREMMSEVKVECPVCSVALTQREVNKHLDMCLTREQKKESLRSCDTGERRRPMGKLVYTLLPLSSLRRKLKEVHLSAQGTRDQLTRRHRDFVHIYNAQCDALHPRSAEDIAKEVEANEKTRNQLRRKDKAVMAFSKNQSLEEIDEVHSNYRRQHSGEYSRLIAQVCGRHIKQEVEGEGPKETTPIKQEVHGEGEGAQGAGAADEAAGVKSGEEEEEEERASTEEEASAWEEEVSAGGEAARSSSPSYSDVSISSSISDVFGPEGDGKCVWWTGQGDARGRPAAAAAAGEDAWWETSGDEEPALMPSTAERNKPLRPDSAITPLDQSDSRTVVMRQELHN